LCGDDAQDRFDWTIGIRGDHLTRASTEKQTLFFKHRRTDDDDLLNNIILVNDCWNQKRCMSAHQLTKPAAVRYSQAQCHHHHRCFNICLYIHALVIRYFRFE